MRQGIRVLTLAVLTAAIMAGPAFARAPLGPVPGEGPDAVEPVSRQRRADIVMASLLQGAQPEPQDKFVPLDELPPEEQLPAAPLLVTAYAFVLLALFAYVLSVARRLGAVQQEVDRLERDLKKSGRT